MSRFDQGARYACKSRPREVARRLLRRVSQSLEFGDLHESKTNPLPGQRERLIDMVLLMKNPEAEDRDEEVQMITTQNDAAVLSDWLDALFVAKSYAGFRKALRK